MRTHPIYINILIACCFFFSGVAGLVYQVAWGRQFSVVFGTSHIAVVCVLASFMGGLAFGALIAGRYADKSRRPLFTYAVLEIGIVLGAVCVFVLLHYADYIFLSFFGDQAELQSDESYTQFVFKFLSSFLILLIPTGMMGATLPFLARYVSLGHNAAVSKIGILYGLNTLGAAIGALLCGLWLIREFGLIGSIKTAVLINVCVAVVAFILHKASGLNVSQDVPMDRANNERGEKLIGASESLTPESGYRHKLAWVYLLIFLSGVVSFAHEVIWTRLLGHLLGGTIIAFSIMLSCFLTGLVIGSLIASYLVSRRISVIHVFVVLQILIGLTAAVVYSCFESFFPEAITPYSAILYSSGVMLPVAILIGITFPIAVKLVCELRDNVGSSTAGVYGWNTLGAIVGAIATGLYILPRFGFQGAVQLTVVVSLFLALLAAIVLSESRVARGFSFALLLVFALFYSPVAPVDYIRSSIASHAQGASGDQTLKYLGAGKSSTVSVFQDGPFIRFYSDGLQESQTLELGAMPPPPSWLTELPMLARPESTNMLIVGLGGGQLLERIHPKLEEIDVIELEEKIIEANKAVSRLRWRDPLENTKIRLVHNDARNALTQTKKRFDIIVSQPSQPTAAGSSHLFTKEFLRLSKNRLSRGGVLIQWASSGYFDEEMLRSMAKTIASEFSYVELYRPATSSLLFVASNEPFDLMANWQQIIQSDSVVSNYYKSMGLDAIEKLIAIQALDVEGLNKFASGAAINSDNWNLVATGRHVFDNPMSSGELSKLLKEYDPLLRLDSGLRRNYFNEVSSDYLVNRLHDIGLSWRAHWYAKMHDSPLVREYLDGIRVLRAGKRESVSKRYLALKKKSGWKNVPDEFRDALDYQLYMLDEKWHFEQSVSDPELRYILQASSLAKMSKWEGVAKFLAQIGSVSIKESWYPEILKLKSRWFASNTLGCTDQSAEISEHLKDVDNYLAWTIDVDLLQFRGELAKKCQMWDKVLSSINMLVYLREQTGFVGADSYRIAELIKSSYGKVKVIGHESIPGFDSKDVLDYLERLEQLELRLDALN